MAVWHVVHPRPQLRRLFGRCVTQWMLTLLAWARYTDRPSRGRYRAALVCFGLGLMAKPMLVSLPIILFLLDLWPLGRLAGKSDPKRVPLDSSEAADCSAETGASAASAGSSRALAALGERDRRQHRAIPQQDSACARRAASASPRLPAS